jgi:uncharacterized Zn finger protein
MMTAPVSGNLSARATGPHTSESAARGFPAFPAGRRGGRGFARTWWGRAWIQAVEDAALDTTALKNGRKYAFSGRVGSITVSPGRLAALVYGAGDTYATALTLRPFTGRQRELFLDQVAARAGHIAALLHREMPHDLIAAAEDVGVPLLPDIDDLDPACDCEDWGHPCRHAAALAYQAAWLVDEDPFLLLLLRGLDEDGFVAALQQRGGAPARRDGPVPARPRTVPADRAYAADLPALPEPPEPPDEPGDMAPIPDAPDTVPELAADALRLLAKDAAVRALDLLRGDTPAEPDERADAVRLAATHHDPAAHARLRAAHEPPADFERAVAAWRFGGAVGLEVCTRQWTPPRDEVARAQNALNTLAEDTGQPAGGFRRNRWTDEAAGIQLRLGPDGRWYPYRAREGSWWPSAHPSPDPTAAYETA